MGTIILWGLAFLGGLSVLGLVSTMFEPEKAPPRRHKEDEEEEDEEDDDGPPQQQGIGWVELMIYDAIAHAPTAKPPVPPIMEQRGYPYK